MRSARLDFFPPEFDDVPELAQMINDEDTRRYLDGRVFPADATAQRAFVETMQNGAKSGGHFMCVLRLRDQPEIIGASGLHDIHRIHRRAEWGIVLNDKARGQGYGQEIARRMVEHAFSGLNLNSVTLRVRADHAAGRACYRKVGFVEEGVCRQACYGDGRYHDQVMMSIIRQDWPGSSAGA